jgi:hypothetical protein
MSNSSGRPATRCGRFAFSHLNLRRPSDVMTRTTTAHLCVDGSDEFIPFLDGLKLLGIPRITAERWLRVGDSRLPTLVRLGGRRFFRRGDLEAPTAPRPEPTCASPRTVGRGGTP